VFGQCKEALTCEEEGIINTAVHATSALQVTQTLKLLVGKKVNEELILVDVWSNKLEKIKVKKNPNCKVCKGEIENKKEKEFMFTLQKCKTRAAYSAKPNKNIKLDLSKLKEEYEMLIDTPILVVVKHDDKEIIVHSYGEIIFKEMEDEEKMTELAKKIYETTK